MILRKYALLFLVILMCNFRLYSQSKTVSTRSEYIESYKELAIKEMQRSGVPASITLAQGMLESDNGNSRLAREAKNHFGIKCHNDWKGPVIYHDDDRQGECFRKYKSYWNRIRITPISL
jgi:flagellum-specific peptidoglycan hydrolase FlgJ